MNTNEQSHTVSWRREHEATAIGLVAMVAGADFDSLHSFAAEALNSISEDLNVLHSAMSPENDSLNEEAAREMLYRISERARALAEIIRRLDHHGSIEPKAPPEGGAA